MNLSLYKLRKQIKRDKSGQGSLVAVVLAGVVGTILISSVTAWYLTIRNNLSGLDDRLEAVSIALNEWQRLEHMTFEDLTNNKEKLKEPYAVGDKFKVSVNIGEEGYFANGKCNALEGEFADETPNCFSDTTMSIYNKDNNVLYTTRTLPLSTWEGNKGELVGTIIPRMSDNFAHEYEAKQYLLCDGSTFDTTKYKKLYQVLGTNRLPNLQGVFLRGYGTQGNYTSGQLGQVQGDAMRKIYGDIPTVQHGDGIIGKYTPGAFMVAGHGYSWATNTGGGYGYNMWWLLQFKNYRYSLSGSKDSGYSLQEHIETDDYQVIPITTRWSDGNPKYGAHAYRTVTLDSSRVVPTDKETRPANIAVKYYIRAK